MKKISITFLMTLLMALGTFHVFAQRETSLIGCFFRTMFNQKGQGFLRYATGATLCSYGAYGTIKVLHEQGWTKNLIVPVGAFCTGIALLKKADFSGWKNLWRATGFSDEEIRGPAMGITATGIGALVVHALCRPQTSADLFAAFLRSDSGPGTKAALWLHHGLLVYGLFATTFGNGVNRSYYQSPVNIDSQQITDLTVRQTNYNEIKFREKEYNKQLKIRSYFITPQACRNEDGGLAKTDKRQIKWDANALRYQGATGLPSELWAHIFSFLPKVKTPKAFLQTWISEREPEEYKKLFDQWEKEEMTDEQRFDLECLRVGAWLKISLNLSPEGQINYALYSKASKGGEEERLLTFNDGSWVNKRHTELLDKSLAVRGKVSKYCFSPSLMHVLYLEHIVSMDKGHKAPEDEKQNVKVIKITWQDLENFCKKSYTQVELQKLLDVAHQSDKDTTCFGVRFYKWLLNQSHQSNHNLKELQTILDAAQSNGQKIIELSPNQERHLYGE